MNAIFSIESSGGAVLVFYIEVEVQLPIGVEVQLSIGVEVQFYLCVL